MPSQRITFFLSLQTQPPHHHASSPSLPPNRTTATLPWQIWPSLTVPIISHGSHHLPKHTQPLQKPSRKTLSPSYSNPKPPPSAAATIAKTAPLPPSFNPPQLLALPCHQNSRIDSEITPQNRPSPPHKIPKSSPSVTGNGTPTTLSLSSGHSHPTTLLPALSSPDLAKNLTDPFPDPASDLPPSNKKSTSSSIDLATTLPPPPSAEPPLPFPVASHPDPPTPIDPCTLPLNSRCQMRSTTNTTSKTEVAACAWGGNGGETDGGAIVDSEKGRGRGRK